MPVGLGRVSSARVGELGRRRRSRRAGIGHDDQERHGAVERRPADRLADAEQARRRRRGERLGCRVGGADEQQPHRLARAGEAKLGLAPRAGQARPDDELVAALSDAEQRLDRGAVPLLIVMADAGGAPPQAAATELANAG